MVSDNEVMKDLQVVVFRLGSEVYGADITQVREIIRVGEITMIPQAPPDIDGMINLRGKITMVVNLRKRLNMEEKAIDSNSRIIVAEVGGKTVGFMVDNVSEVKYIKGGQIEPMCNVLADGPDHSYIQGICKLKDHLLILVNLGKVFGTQQDNKMVGTAIV
jgi:purine-binding chemotaxis protein CheW